MFLHYFCGSLKVAVVLDTPRRLLLVVFGDIGMFACSRLKKLINTGLFRQHEVNIADGNGVQQVYPYQCFFFQN